MPRSVVMSTPNCSHHWTADFDWTKLETSLLILLKSKFVTLTPVTWTAPWKLKSVIIQHCLLCYDKTQSNQTICAVRRTDHSVSMNNYREITFYLRIITNLLHIQGFMKKLKWQCLNRRQLGRLNTHCVSCVGGVRLVGVFCGPWRFRRYLWC